MVCLNNPTKLIVSKCSFTSLFHFLPKFLFILLLSFYYSAAYLIEEEYWSKICELLLIVNFVFLHNFVYFVFFYVENSEQSSYEIIRGSFLFLLLTFSKFALKMDIIECVSGYFHAYNFM